MAKAEYFHTSIKQEGSDGATRGKIPVGMGRAMGAKDGDVIEWKVVDGECKGGRVLSKSERKALEKDKAAAKKTTAPAKKTKSKSKVKGAKPKVRKDTEAPVKKGKKVKGKVSKSKTKVSMEKPKVKKGKVKKAKKKSGKYTF